MTSQAELEGKYRKVFRIFPACYRHAREDELVEVLLAAAQPGQVRPVGKEVWALVLLAGKTWTRQLLSPDLRAGRDAAGILTVLIPMLFMFPAGAAFAQLGLGFTWRDVTQFPGWGLWVVAAVLTLWAPPLWARWAAMAAICAYLGGIAVQLSDLNFAKSVILLGWVSPQIVGCVLLFNADRVDRGRRLLGAVKPPLLGGLAALGGSVYVGLRIPRYDNMREILAVAGILVSLAVGILLLRSAVGRAMIPIVAALAATVVVAQSIYRRFGNYSEVVPGYATIPGWGTAGTIAVTAGLTFLVLRLVISVLERCRVKKS